MPNEDMGRYFKIYETKKYGVVLRVDDMEVADEFEDFLTEKHYVLFEVGFEEKSELFYFGQSSCVEKVKELVEKFLSNYS